MQSSKINEILNRWKHVGKYELSTYKFEYIAKSLSWDFDNIQIIHVAGTNGKGSVCHYLNNVISTDKNVGLFTSPHILSCYERIRFNNKNITDIEFLKLIEKYESLIDEYMLNFFEIYLLIAIAFFIEKKADIFIIEAGIGGLFDSTNFFKKTQYVCISSIGYDHTELLGKNIYSIAYQKIAIVKKSNKLIVTSINNKKILIFIKFLALLKCKSVLNIYSDVKFINYHSDKNQIEFKYKNNNLLIDTIAKNQIYNASLAISILIKMGYSNEFIFKNLNNNILKKSLEKICIKNNKYFYLDGAHNAAAIKVLMENIKFLNWTNDNTVIIFNSKMIKCPNEMLNIINDYGFKNIYLYDSKNNLNNFDPAKIKTSLYINSVSDLKKIYEKLCVKYKNIIFTGSIYFIAEVKKTFRR